MIFISVYIPAGSAIHEMSNKLREEISQASNIKSKSTRTNVQGALERIIGHLRIFKHMLRKRDNTTTMSNDHQQIDTLIGAHSVITGELSFEGAVRIDGRFEGNIHSSKGGTLIVSEGAKIFGEVERLRRRFTTS